MTTALDAQALLVAATTETGLADYGDPTLPERFAAAVEHLNSLGMDDAGIASATQVCRWLLTSRLVFIEDRNIHAIREAILAPKFNYGAPRIAATAMHHDGSLELTHDYQSDGRGLDTARADRVLDYLSRVWRRPVTLHTIDDRGYTRDISSKKR